MNHPTDSARRARELNRIRRLGYRLFPGDAFSYILHMRPAEWPIMAAHTALGYFLAVGFHASELAATWPDALFGLVIWVIFLNGGTLAINTAYDRDTGDIGYLVAPPDPPRRLAAFSIALMAAGQALAFLLPPGFTVAYAICFVLSLLYSVPPIRLKAVAGADWIINMWGFGTLTPFAGWATTGQPLENWAALVFLAFCPLFAALYPLTQLYQLEVDRERGDRTLALMLGMRRSLQVAIFSVILAFAGLAAGAILAPANRLWPLLILACAAWLAVLGPWYARRDSMSPEQHQRGMYLALHAWAVTDIAVLLCFAFR